MPKGLPCADAPIVDDDASRTSAPLDAHVTPDWLIRQVRGGTFPGRKIGWHWLFTDADIQSIRDIKYRPHFEQPRNGMTPITRRWMTARRRSAVGDQA